MTDHTVLIVYKNHRGELGTRVLRPVEGSLRFTATPWHPDEQWVFDAWDLDKNAVRTFTMKDIGSWQTVPEAVPGKGAEEEG